MKKLSIEQIELLSPELKESEEDEKIRKEIIEVFKRLGEGTIPANLNYADIFTWLEKQGKKPAGWHREDEQNLNACLGYIRDEFLRRWLIDVIHSKYDKPSWSEEDEESILEICNYLDRLVREDEDNQATRLTVQELKDWLKSLRPQNCSVTDEELAQAKKEAYNDALDKIEYHSGEPTFDDGWDAAIWYLKKRNVLH